MTEAGNDSTGGVRLEALTPVQTLYEWRTKGYGPKRIRVGRYVRYRREDVLAWVESQAGE